MSGGHFNYAYSKVEQFVEELEADLSKDSVDDLNFATLAQLHKILMDAKRLSELMNATELLFSGDTGEDSFMEHTLSINAKYHIISQKVFAELLRLQQGDIDENDES